MELIVLLSIVHAQVYGGASNSRYESSVLTQNKRIEHRKSAVLTVQSEGLPGGMPASWAAL
jgi:hypothetical protein